MVQAMAEATLYLCHTYGIDSRHFNSDSVATALQLPKGGQEGMNMVR